MPEKKSNLAVLRGWVVFYRLKAEEAERQEKHYVSKCYRKSMLNAIERLKAARLSIQ